MTCTRCFTDKPPDEFGPDRRKRNGRRSWCLSCERAARTAARAADPEKARESGRTARHRRKARTRQRVADAKAQPCADCGRRYPSYVMDFDHVRGEKCFGIAQAATLDVGERRLSDELAKCDVVCANCHRERTHGRRTATPI